VEGMVLYDEEEIQQNNTASAYRLLAGAVTIMMILYAILKWGISP